jgi:hypothetical protein
LKDFELLVSKDMPERAPKNVFWRNAEFGRNVRADLAHNEIRLGECEQESMRLDAADDLDLLLGAPVVAEQRPAVLDGKRAAI